MNLLGLCGEFFEVKSGGHVLWKRGYEKYIQSCSSWIEEQTRNTIKIKKYFLLNGNITRFSNIDLTFDRTRCDKKGIVMRKLLNKSNRS